MNKFTKIVAIVIAITAATLLVGQRFQASWAGGGGLQQHTPVTTPNGQIYHRGETVRAEQASQFSLGESTVYLDENTQVKIINSINGQETMNVIQGRVVVQGPVTIKVREVDVGLNGTTSFVHYSWLDEVDILNIDGTVTVHAEETERTLAPGEGARMNTIPPYTFLLSTLDLEASSAAGFYEKTLH